VEPFRIDLHVHTARYSPCAETVEPREIAAWACRAGLHGVVLTDHDILWELEEVESIQRAFPGARLFRGTECSARGAHLLVIGLADAAHLHRGIAVEDAVEVAHAGRAAAILAHPFRAADPTGLPLGSLDAIEVASTSFSREETARALALAWESGRPAVAGSDAHALCRIGWAYTEFPEMPADERELAAMLTAGQGTPVVAGPWASSCPAEPGG
jgi:predicted metal-dependent phosphoesterase TrpH